MKDILVLVHHDAGQDARLRAAVDLARRLGGHLTCLDVTKLPATFGTEFAAGAMLLEQESRREHHNRDVVQSWLTRQGAPWTWLDCTGSLASSVIDAAGLADLIVLNRRLDDAMWPDMRDVTANVLMHLHNPIVAMPEDAEDLPSRGDLWRGMGSLLLPPRFGPPFRCCSWRPRSKSSWSKIAQTGSRATHCSRISNGMQSPPPSGSSIAARATSPSSSWTQAPDSGPIISSWAAIRMDGPPNCSVASRGRYCRTATFRSFFPASALRARLSLIRWC